ncbi:MAG: DUF4214 domain-containing protein [Chlorobiales bacterium]|nr:DUF4214 domain-containing protein [Chlorobiales bacterium]
MSGQIEDLVSLFSEDFNNPLVSANWNLTVWTLDKNASFNGRTQYNTHSLPTVSNGVLPLVLYTYNPTNNPNYAPSFYGTEIISHNQYLPGTSFEIKAHFDNSVTAGIVGGFFLYNFRDATHHDEIDFEAISNHPNQIQTNVYNNEPLGAGHPQSSQLSSALTEDHTYRIEWFTNAIRWFVDGQLVREQTDNIPQNKMSLYLDIYAPGDEWPYALSSALNPVTNSNTNTAYRFDIDSVRISELPTIQTGTSGNDSFNGDAGAKTVLFSGNEANYTINLSGSGFSIKDNVGTDGTDTVIHVDKLLFSDHTLTIATNPSNTLLESYLIYKAAFDRTPDYGGLGYWFKAIDHGASLHDVAGGFMDSNEFKAMYGDNPTDSNFVNLLYQHVMGRTPDQGGYVYWMTALHGVSREEVLVDFTISRENLTNVAGVIANGIIYEAYTG